MAKKEIKVNKEMTTEEARAFRASLYKTTVEAISDKEKREQFRLFWAKERKAYGNPKGLEEILWVHLKASKLDSPEQFEAGLKHFGLQKVR